MSSDRTLDEAYKRELLEKMDRKQEFLDANPDIKSSFNRMAEEGKDICKTLEDAEKMVKDLKDGKLIFHSENIYDMGLILQSPEGDRREVFDPMHNGALIDKYGQLKTQEMLQPHIPNSAKEMLGYMGDQITIDPSIAHEDLPEHSVKKSIPAIPDVKSCSIS